MEGVEGEVGRVGGEKLRVRLVSSDSASALRSSGRNVPSTTALSSCDTPPRPALCLYALTYYQPTTHTAETGSAFSSRTKPTLDIRPFQSSPLLLSPEHRCTELCGHALCIRVSTDTFDWTGGWLGYRTEIAVPPALGPALRLVHHDEYQFAPSPS